MSSPLELSIWALAVFAAVSGVSSLNRTSPTESLYDIQLGISDQSRCTSEVYDEFCEALVGLQYKECELISRGCNRNVQFRVSFGYHESKNVIMEHLSTLQDYRGMSILRSKVDDLNECSENIHGCSKNGYCTNIMGTYRCQCGFGYQQSLTATHPPGTYCVARCTQRSCKNGGSCSAAPDEVSEVTCECQKGYAGESCEDKTGINNLSRETIVVIAVVASIAALLGVVLSVFACYTLFRRRVTDDSSEASSISGFKPKSLSAHEYDRMTDLGSVSRANHSFVSTIDEEPESTSIKSNSVFNSGLMGSRRSIPSEHGDPTPALSPVNRTDRHAASDISQPDYY